MSSLLFKLSMVFNGLASYFLKMLTIMGMFSSFLLPSGGQSFNLCLVIAQVFNTTVGSSSSIVVEHSPHNSKIKGFSPAYSDGTEREREREKVVKNKV